MHHGSKVNKEMSWQNELVSNTELLDNVESHLPYDPTPGTSQLSNIEEQCRSPGHDETASSNTIQSRMGSGQEFQSNIRPYVAELDQIVASYRAGNRTKFEVMSAIIEKLNKDANLTSQEKLRSFELYMAEIDSECYWPSSFFATRDARESEPAKN